MKSHLNLLPYDYLRRELLRRRLVQWAVVCSVTLVLVLITGWMQRVNDAVMANHLESLRAEYEPVRQLEVEAASLQRQLDEIKSREAITLNLAINRPVLTLLGVVSTAAKQGDGHVAVGTLAVVETAARDKHSQADAPTNTVSLDGIADDDVAIARFAAALRTGQVFRTVSLKNTGDHEISAVKVRSFSIECAY